jgi:hypothetical protein
VKTRFQAFAFTWVNLCRYGEEELDPLEFYGFLTPKLDQLNMDPSFLSRNVNEVGAVAQLRVVQLLVG